MKKVLVDLSHLGVFCGFGEIDQNYASRLSKLEFDDMKFVFLVPKDYIGAYGDNVEYVEIKEKYEKKRDLDELPYVDWWHATTQRFHYRAITKGTIQLMTIHDLNFLYDKSKMGRIERIWRLQRKINKSDYMTTISHYAERDILKHMNLHGKNLQVIYNGVRNIDLQPEKQPAFIKDTNEKFFFSIGQILAKKNFHVLVPMMKHFPEYKLYIAGDERFDYDKVVRQVIQDKHCENQVLMVGKVDEAEKVWLYRHCEAFTFPSKVEGFGIPVLEAMMCGKAVFTSNCTSLPEIGGQYSFVWDNFETEYMTNVVKENLTGFYKRADFIQQMKQYAQGFSYERYTNEYVALYRKLLGLKSLSD